MSKTARLIMYPLLVLVLGFFAYTMFFMEPKEAEPTAEPVSTEQVEEAVEVQDTTEVETNAETDSE